MPTMIQRFECGYCFEVYDTTPAAVVCVTSHPLDGGEPTLDVVTLNLWECDGEDCQQTFDDQFSAQACEVEHQTGQDTAAVSPLRLAAGAIMPRWGFDSMERWS